MSDLTVLVNDALATKGASKAGLDLINSGRAINEELVLATFAI